MCPCRPLNREIIGYSAGEHKTAGLVKEAFQSVEGSLEISAFSTQTAEMNSKTRLLRNCWKRSHKRSLSQKGCPYDNAVAEATFKIIKRIRME